MEDVYISLIVCLHTYLILFILSLKKIAVYLTLLQSKSLYKYWFLPVISCVLCCDLRYQKQSGYTQEFHFGPVIENI